MTNDAIIKVLDKAYKTVNDNDYFGVISLDLFKAFDIVDHSVLLTKLYNYGIKGLSLNLFKSYLSDRFQYVTFLLYINLIPNSLKNIADIRK